MITKIHVLFLVAKLQILMCGTEPSLNQRYKIGQLAGKINIVYYITERGKLIH